jgi:hypothetical protein
MRHPGPTLGSRDSPIHEIREGEPVRGSARVANLGVEQVEMVEAESEARNRIARDGQLDG